MEIIAHRGFWKEENEKNTMDAFIRAWDHGYGIETDIRDRLGELVISHNPANAENVSFEDFLKEYARRGNDTILALNIKADGLASLAKEALLKYGVSNYFYFDMSVPDMLDYREQGLVYYTRQSDIEKDCVLYSDAGGVWMDSFFEYDWIGETAFMPHLEVKKGVVVVSPDLHGMDNKKVWERLNISDLVSQKNLYLCTDFPDEADMFFS